MNLYVIKFIHYSSKDSIEGIITYLVAKSDKDVYEWLKTEPEIDGKSLYNSYQENEDDDEIFDIYNNDYEVIGSETFKERMIRLHGQMYDEDTDVSDAYYGVTHYGWKIIKEDISDYDVILARSLNINIEDITK